MSATSISVPTPVESPATSNDSLAVVVLYDDAESGRIAESTVNTFACPRSVNDGINLTLWKFSLLEVAGLRSMALTEARHANVLVIATHEGTALPKAVSSYIDDSLDHDDAHPRTMMALLDIPDAPGEGAAPVSSWLRSAANRARIDFFCNISDWSARR